MSSNIDILINARDNASAAIRNVGSAFGDISRQAAGFALAQVGIASLSAIVEKAGAAFIGYNARMEQTKVSMETMLGSAVAAQTFMAQMAAFAEETPFEFEDVSRAAKKFLAFGWAANDVIPALTAVGNAAAGLGIGKEGIDRITLALGQMSQKTKLSGEEVRQLNEAGIGAQKYLADAFNLTGDAFNDLSKTGITGTQAVKAILDGMANDPKFAQMMEKQSKTAIGLWSTMKDQAGTIFGAIGQTAFESMKGTMETVTKSLAGLVKAIREGGVEKAFNELVPPEWQVRIEKVFNLVASYWDAMTSSLAGGAEGGSAALETIGAAIDFLLPIFEQFLNVVVFVFDAAVRAFNNVAVVVKDFVTEVIAGFNDLYDSTIGIWTALGDALEWIWDAIGASIWQKVKDFVVGILDALGPIGKIVEGVGAGIASAWEAAGSGPKVTTGGSSFRNFIGGMKGFGGVTAEGLAALAEHKGTPMDMEPGGDDKGAKGHANRLEKQTDKMSELVADLTAKIIDDTQDALTSNLAKMAAEIIKWQNDIDEAGRAGADTKDAQAALNVYKTVHEQKLRDDVLKAQNTLARETKGINADLTDDYRQAADDRYSIAVQSAEAEAVEKRKAGMSAGAVEDWLTAKIKAAAKDRTDARASGYETDYTNAVEHINNLAIIEGKSNAWISEQSRALSEQKIADLKNELAQAETTKARRIAIEKEIADETAKINNAKRYDISTAWGEAAKDIANTQLDFATVMGQAWNDISNSIGEHIKGILQQTEGLGSGMKAIFHDITQSIQEMFLQMAIEQFIMAPVRNWFSGILSNMGGHKASGGDVFGGRPYVVGENGPEVFTPGTNGQITPNGALGGYNGPAVIMNITTPNAESFRRSSGQIYAGMNAALASGRRFM